MTIPKAPRSPGRLRTRSRLMTARSTTTTRTHDRIVSDQAHESAPAFGPEGAGSGLGTSRFTAHPADEVRLGRTGGAGVPCGRGDEAAEIFDPPLHLFVRGAKDDFLALFTRPRPSLSIWTLWLDVAAIQGEVAILGSGGCSCMRGVSVLYGFAGTEEEYEAKHATSRRPREALWLGWPGASLSSFFEYLPGLYWLTIFGPSP